MTKDECIDEVLSVLTSNGSSTDDEVRGMLESVWNQGTAYGIAQTMKAVELATSAGIPATRVLPHKGEEKETGR